MEFGTALTYNWYSLDLSGSRFRTKKKGKKENHVYKHVNLSGNKYTLSANAVFLL